MLIPQGESSVLIKDERLAFVLIENGTCFKRDYILEHMKNSTFALEFGKSPSPHSYIISYNGDDEWLFMYDKENVTVKETIQEIKEYVESTGEKWIPHR